MANSRRGDTSKLSNAGGGDEGKGQMPAQKTPLNLFAAWPEMLKRFATRTLLIIHATVLDLKFPNL